MSMDRCKPDEQQVAWVEEEPSRHRKQQVERKPRWLRNKTQQSSSEEIKTERRGEGGKASPKSHEREFLLLRMMGGDGKGN